MGLLVAFCFFNSAFLLHYLVLFLPDCQLVIRGVVASMHIVQHIVANIHFMHSSCLFSLCQIFFHSFRGFSCSISCAILLSSAVCKVPTYQPNQVKTLNIFYLSNYKTKFSQKILNTFINWKGKFIQKLFTHKMPWPIGPTFHSFVWGWFMHRELT